ncbi:hypothetical protein BZL29_8130 [Mycobacterium kansasii]|uniref:Uncharacterized protein n=1 Tax=Mycobacterium kansasii TaxID=1768 RepID=A0A1V3WDB8_MYCKA|nr:hypothetical protein BZL29_8130 [Mycobacterium kansasii]
MAVSPNGGDVSAAVAVLDVAAVRVSSQDMFDGLSSRDA